MIQFSKTYKRELLELCKNTIIRDCATFVRTEKKTQKEIAEVLNTTYQYYSAYERGVRDIPSHHIKTLALYYNISADYLLGLTDEPKALK